MVEDDDGRWGEAVEAFEGLNNQLLAREERSPAEVDEFERWEGKGGEKCVGGDR